MTPCSVPFCDRPSASRRLCSMHYQRSRSGKPLDDPIIARGLGWQEALAHYLDQIADRSDCWTWPLAPDVKGYGRLDDGDGNRRLAHRMSWIFHCGPIPPGYVVDHKCRNRMCVRPAHLRLVTPTVNTLENSVGVAAVSKAKTHCTNGHPLSGDNVYWRPDRPGSRDCRTCVRDAKRRARARKT